MDSQALGEAGQDIQRELHALGWWNSVDAYRRDFTRTLAS